MKKILATLALAFCLFGLTPTVAKAQCTGQFPAGSICGNLTGSAALPRVTTTPFSLGTSLSPTVVAPVTTTATTTNTNAAIVVTSATGLTTGMAIFAAFASTCSTANAAFVEPYIVSIVGTTVTMSCPATATNASPAAVQFGQARYDTTSSLLVNSGGFGRLLVGAAAQGNTAGWLPAISTGLSYRDVPTLMVVTPLVGGGVAGVFAGRTSDARGGNSTIGVECLFYADAWHAGNEGGWCSYTQSNLAAATNTGPLHIQHEYSINSLWDVTDIDPYNVNAAKSTRNMRIDCGTGQSGSPFPNTCSAAVDIVNNGAGYKAGIVVGDGALDTSGRIAPAVSLPKNTGVSWFSAAATPLASVYGEMVGGFPVLSLSVPTNGGMTFLVNSLPIWGTNATVLYPVTTNALTLGDASLRFANVYSVLANFSGGVTASGLPTTAGAGGLYVCVDTAGVLYKKSACP